LIHPRKSVLPTCCSTVPSEKGQTCHFMRCIDLLYFLMLRDLWTQSLNLRIHFWYEVLLFLKNQQVWQLNSSDEYQNSKAMIVKYVVQLLELQFDVKHYQNNVTYSVWKDHLALQAPRLIVHFYHHQFSKLILYSYINIIIC